MEQYSRDYAVWKRQVALGEVRKNKAPPKKPTILQKKYRIGGKKDSGWDEKLADDLLEELTANPNTPLRYTMGRTLRNTLGADIQGVGIRERAREELEKNELEL